jgi:hypothetical protein
MKNISSGQNLKKVILKLKWISCCDICISMTIFDDCRVKLLFLHQMKGGGIAKWEVWEIPLTIIATTLAPMKFVTTSTKDYGYAECEC